MVIYKQVLSPADVQRIRVEQGATILSADEQFEGICIWYMCEPKSLLKEYRTIHIYGTGHIMKDDCNLRFINTVKLNGGSLIFHVFEEIS